VLRFYCYTECRYPECRHAESCYPEYHYAECLYAMCGNAERRYAECRGATLRVSTEMHFCQKKMNFKDRNEKMAPQQPV